jgi:hypothetical protein
LQGIAGLGGTEQCRASIQQLTSVHDFHELYDSRAASSRPRATFSGLRWKNLEDSRRAHGYIAGVRHAGFDGGPAVRLAVATDGWGDSAGF